MLINTVPDHSQSAVIVSYPYCTSLCYYLKKLQPVKHYRSTIQLRKLNILLFNLLAYVNFFCEPLLLRSSLQQINRKWQPNKSLTSNRSFKREKEKKIKLKS